jgi:GxxExxY protein
MTELLYKDLTYTIIGAAMEVHTVLGPGFLEAVYQSVLAHELSLREIPFQQQQCLSVAYKDTVVGEYRPDFIVDEKLIIEIKASKKLTEIDEAQLINYLKATGIRVGVLINFGAKSLQHKRRIV